VRKTEANRVSHDKWDVRNWITYFRNHF